MTKADELRRLLKLHDGVVLYVADGTETDWRDRNGELVQSFEAFGRLFVTMILTPEEAVAATMGRSAPLVVDKSEDAIESCWCGHCSKFLGRIFDGYYCPRCGWEVER